MPEYLPVYIDYRAASATGQLAEVWQALEADRLWQPLFYDGAVKDFAAFMKEMARPGCLPFAVYADGKLAMFSWLNHIQGKTARAHFVVFRQFWGKERRISLGKFLYDYLLSAKDGHGYLFDCLYGITPATYKLAIKAVLASGWAQCGVIPAICWLDDRQEWVAGVVSCATREILGIE